VIETDALPTADDKLNRERAARSARSGWDPELVESLYDLLDTVDTTSPDLLDGLESLEVKYEDLVYRELIFLLSRLRFDPDEAKDHWNRILEYRSRMQVAQEHPLDVRVALVNYFVEVSRKVQNPGIVEMKIFERTGDCSYRDELTGLHNQRLFCEYLEQEILRSRRYGAPLSLVMIEVDNFRLWNATHGHEAGNALLTAVASILERELRRSDGVARYGAEEFTLILPATSKTHGGLVAERARETIESHRFPIEGESAAGSVTVSMGVASFPADTRDAGDLVRYADRAMYVAKSNGKNQVRLYRNCLPG
jgi:diguanylate cyclase (GGDEF)-like protein